MSIAYLNGAFSPLQELRIPVLDRGFIFGDGVYEVIPVYQGHLFRLDKHLQRLANSLHSVRIPNPCTSRQWEDLLQELVLRNGGGGQALYLQVTRGVAPRNHAFPVAVPPTIFAMSNPLPEQGTFRSVKAITRVDNRWGRCDVKAIALLPNILLRQEAIDRECTEAILLRDGFVTEGAASNVFMVTAEFIVTPPPGPHLLSGITRDLVLEICAAADLPYLEAPIAEDSLRSADEIWLTSSTMEVVAVVHLDGVAVGSGKAGLVGRKIWTLLQDYKRQVVGSAGKPAAAPFVQTA
jgi:D-alanine transaminase